ncbi:MAG: hypothetical protein V3R81_02795 [Gammaproteobacteria bacterium]
MLRNGGETWPALRGGVGVRPGAPVLKFLRPLLAIYGSGIAGTFAWLFFALSGTSACASGTEPCRIVVGLTGQLALVWPAYWGGRITGNATMTPIVPVEIVVVAVLAFLAVLALAQAYNSLERKEQGPVAERKQHDTARNEPLIKTSEPNRRNQSRP